MVSTPQVSIITTAYNAVFVVKETIESDLSQFYSNWKLIVVDDSSSDKTYEIVMSFSNEDRRIRIFITDNLLGSPSVPRNMGVEHSNGKYIAFLDADDLWLPDKLEKQVGFIMNSQLRHLTH